MANRPQAIANNAEENARSPESSGKEKPTPLPPEPKEIQQLTPHQPSESSGAEQRTSQHPPPEASVIEQLTPQQPPESSGAEQQPAPPKEKERSPGGKRVKSKEKKKQKQAASEEKQSTTLLEGVQRFSNSVLAKSKMLPEENLGTNKEQMASTSKENQVTKRENSEEDMNQPMVQSKKKMSKTQSEEKQSASSSGTKEATKFGMEEEHEALASEVEDWTGLLEEEEPATLTVRGQTSVVFKGKQMIMLAEANQQQRQTEEKQSSEPKRKNSRERLAMKGVEKQSSTQPATQRSNVSTNAQQATLIEARQKAMLHDEEKMTALFQKLSSATIGNQEKANSAVGAEFNDPAVTFQLTSGELEELYFEELERGLPRHFSMEKVRARRINGQVRMTNPHVLVHGCPEGISYPRLFGSWTQEEGYKSGPIVNTMDAMVPLLKKSSAAIVKARKYLLEAYMVRRGELRKKTPSYKSHLYMVKVVEGTLTYFDELVQWLSLSDADPWVPLGERPNATR